MKSRCMWVFVLLAVAAVSTIPAEGWATDLDMNGVVTEFELPSDENPFSGMDKARAERIDRAKCEVGNQNQNSFKNGLSSDEKKQRDMEMLSNPGERHIVKFKEDASLQEIFKIVSLYQYELLGYSEDRIFMIRLADEREFEQEFSDMIEFIEEDRKRKIQVIPYDTYYDEQWALSAIKMPEAWDITTGSNSVSVAVIDSGIDAYHPDLIGADIRWGHDYIFNDVCDWDSTGHGTNVTGIIGAQTNNANGISGVNWNVAIIPMRVVYSDGSIYSTYTYQAIIDAADSGCDVINLSLGGEYYSSVENSAIQYAISKGCIVVASAGNDGTAVYMYPASYEGVISVGSVNQDLSHSYFSQFNDKVDVAAPGSGILTTADSYYCGYDYDYSDGTSFAAPHVSGVAALAVACKPSITAAEFVNAIKASSLDLGNSGFDNLYGNGLLDAQKTLEYVTAPDSPSDLNMKSVGDGSVEIGWQANKEFDIAGYLLEYKTSTSSLWSYIAVDKMATSYKIGDLVNGISYSFRIKARDEAGNWSGYSEVVSAMPSIPEAYIEMPEKTNVPLNKVWTVKFNLKPDMNTVSSSSIYVSDSSGTIIMCNIAQGEDPDTVTVTPASGYRPNETYTLHIAKSIMSQERRISLLQPVIMKFSTLGE